MGIIAEIEKVLKEEEQKVSQLNWCYDRVTILPSAKLRKAIDDHYGYSTSHVYGLGCVVTVESKTEEGSWSYFTFFDGQNVVNFISQSDVMLGIDHVAISEVPKSDDTRFCSHEWKEYLGLFKTYKDCVKCGKKWEDL